MNCWSTGDFQGCEATMYDAAVVVTLMGDVHSKDFPYHVCRGNLCTFSSILL